MLKEEESIRLRQILHKIGEFSLIHLVATINLIEPRCDLSFSGYIHILWHLIDLGMLVQFLVER